jgi:iron complex outermembrane receptor protein
MKRFERNGTNQPDAAGNWNRPGQNQKSEQIIGEQISVQGSFTTGKIKHQLFTGIDLENSFFTIL